MDVVPIRVAGVKSAARRIHWDLCSSAVAGVVGSKMAMIEYCESRDSRMPAKGTAHAGIELIPGRLQWEAVGWATGQIAI